MPFKLGSSHGHALSRWEQAHQDAMELQDSLKAKKTPVQAKSETVSDPDDVHEKQADDIAAKVSAGENVSLHAMNPTTASSLQAKQEGDAGSSASSQFTSSLNSSKSSGQPLSENLQNELGSQMGANFSDVKIHNDENAHALSKDIHARAFTQGQDIYFGQGQFNPQSGEGKNLLAHELVHTQQQGGPPLKRKITIAGKDYVPTADDYTKYDKELLDRLYNGGSEPENIFADQASFEMNLKMRGSLIKTMTEVAVVNNASCGFGLNPATKGFSLPSKFWNYDKANDLFTLVADAGVTPAEAVKSIFNNGQKQTYLDCNMMMVAAQYRSILEASKDDNEFNARFAGGKNLIIGQIGKIDDIRTVEKEGYPQTDSGQHPFMDKGLYEEFPLNPDTLNAKEPSDDLLPGDWVYFTNLSTYIDLVKKVNVEIIHSNQNKEEKDKENEYSGAWQGEHAVYAGNKLFCGFGFTAPVPYATIVAFLKGNYLEVYDRYYGNKPISMTYSMEEKERRMGADRAALPDPYIRMIRRPITENIRKLPN